MSQLRLRLSASPDEMAFARAAITRLCEHFQIADAQTENIRLAVTEACSNCVLHAYGRQMGVGTYVLDARVDNDALHITVCDSGVGVHNAQAAVDPASNPASDPASISSKRWQTARRSRRAPVAARAS